MMPAVGLNGKSLLLVYFYHVYMIKLSRLMRALYAYVLFLRIFVVKRIFIWLIEMNWSLANNRSLLYLAIWPNCVIVSGNLLGCYQTIYL